MVEWGFACLKSLNFLPKHARTMVLLLTICHMSKNCVICDEKMMWTT